MGLPPSDPGVQRTVTVLSFTSLVSIFRGLGRTKNHEYNVRQYSAKTISWSTDREKQTELNRIIIQQEERYRRVTLMYFFSPLLRLFIRVGLTCHYCEGLLVFVIIKPARDIHTAAVHPWVAHLQLPDGQWHITFAEITSEQVTLWQTTDHWCPVWLDHLIGTASVGDVSPAPAHSKPAVIVCIIAAW